MRFTKMQAVGNDYVVISAFDEPRVLEVADAPDFARRVCDRHYGVGADGLIILAPPAEGVSADAAMLIINADGGPGGTCGNGLRCAAKRIVDDGCATPDEHGRVFIHLSGRTCAINVFFDEESGAVDAACCDLGAPETELARIPVEADRLGAHDDEHVHVIEGAALSFVSMGNPHAVCFTDEPERLVFTLGPKLERHPAFPERVNAHFVKIASEREAVALSWERGVGHTLGCGSGACAIAVAGHLTGRLARDPVVRAPGGDLIVRWDAASNHVFLTGPAEHVFDGVLPG